MTRQNQDWGFRATSPTAWRESVFAGLASLFGVGIAFVVFVGVLHYQIYSDLRAVQAWSAADRVDVVATSTRSAAGD